MGTRKSNLKNIDEQAYFDCQACILYHIRQNDDY